MTAAPIRLPAPQGPRREHRDEVLHATTAITPDGRSLYATVVNISPHGLMARCEAPLGAGDTLAVRLPDRPPAAVTVRWVLGGRIGCEFAAAIDGPGYAALLARLGG